MSGAVSLVEVDDVTAAEVRGSIGTARRFALGFPREEDLQALDARERGALAFLVVADGEVVGTCGTHGPLDGVVELGWGIAPSARGRGVGTTAVGALVDVVRERAPSATLVARTEWHDSPEGLRAASPASEQILSRLGFVGDPSPAVAGARTWRGAHAPAS